MLPQSSMINSEKQKESDYLKCDRSALIFHAIPKCGGTSTLSMLALNIKTLFRIRHSLDYFVFDQVITSGSLPGRILVTSHDARGISDFILRDHSRKAYYITVLRDPISLVLSACSYVNAIMGNDKPPFEKFAERHPNLLLARLGGSYNVAKEAIENEYDAFGLLERFPETLRLFSQRYNLGKCYTAWKNKTPEGFRNYKNKTEKRLLQVVEKQNEEAIALYEWASEEFNRRYAKTNNILSCPYKKSSNKGRSFSDSSNALSNARDNDKDRGISILKERLREYPANYAAVHSLLQWLQQAKPSFGNRIYIAHAASLLPPKGLAHLSAICPVSSFLPTLLRCSLELLKLPHSGSNSYTRLLTKDLAENLPRFLTQLSSENCLTSMVEHTSKVFFMAHNEEPDWEDNLAKLSKSLQVNLNSLIQKDLEYISDKVNKYNNKILLYGLTHDSLQTCKSILFPNDHIDIVCEYPENDQTAGHCITIHPNDVNINLYDLVVLSEPYKPDYARFNIIRRGWDKGDVYDLFANIPLCPFFLTSKQELILSNNALRSMGNRLIW